MTLLIALLFAGTASAHADAEPHPVVSGIETHQIEARAWLLESRADGERVRSQCLRLAVRDLRAYRWSASLLARDLGHVGDLGYPADAGRIEESLAAVGRGAERVHQRARACGVSSLSGAVLVQLTPVGELPDPIDGPLVPDQLLSPWEDEFYDQNADYPFGPPASPGL